MIRWASADTPRYSSGMIIPPSGPEAAQGRCQWTGLDSAGKRERLLEAATEVFGRDGLDAPMSVVADAAGAGVASVYRLFRIQARAAGGPGRAPHGHRSPPQRRRRSSGRATAGRRSTEMLTTLVERPARRLPHRRRPRRGGRSPRRDRRGRPRASEAQERLLAAARAEGRLRADATRSGPPAAVRRHPRRQAGRARAVAADARADDRRARCAPRLRWPIGWAPDPTTGKEASARAAATSPRPGRLLTNSEPAQPWRGYE